MAPRGSPPESFLTIGIWSKLGTGDDVALAAVEDLLDRYPYEALGWLWIPELDPIRDEPRYRAVAARFNLEGVEPQRTPGVASD